MGCADISACEHQVRNIFGIQGSQRYTVRLGQTLFLQMEFVLALHIEAAGQMIVDLPATVSHLIIKESAAFHILLCQHIIANIAAAFPLTRQETNEIQLPVIRTVVAVVFHVIPHAVGNFNQFIPHFFCIVDGVNLTTQFNPIEIGFNSVQTVVRFEFHFLIGGKLISPIGGNKFAFMVGFVGLNHQTHTHRFLVSLF